LEASEHVRKRGFGFAVLSEIPPVAQGAVEALCDLPEFLATMVSDIAHSAPSTRSIWRLTLCFPSQANFIAVLHVLSRRVAIAHVPDADFVAAAAPDGARRRKRRQDSRIGPFTVGGVDMHTEVSAEPISSDGAAIDNAIGLAGVTLRPCEELCY
jgi:hypothetical protein